MVPLPGMPGRGTVLRAHVVGGRYGPRPGAELDAGGPVERGRGVRIRAAAPDDVDAVTRLPGLGDSTRRLLRTDLARGAPRHAAVAATADGAVVGFAMATRQADAAHVLDVVVDPDRRRHGTATALLAWLAGRAVADGTPALTLEVRVGNTAARALYAGLGFQDAGARPGYYADGEDARVMWHHDPSAVATLRRR